MRRKTCTAPELVHFIPGARNASCPGTLCSVIHRVDVRRTWRKMPLRDPAQAVTSIPQPRDQSETHLLHCPHVWSMAELRRAVADGEFVLHYQPVISLVDGGIAGVE